MKFKNVNYKGLEDLTKIFTTEEVIINENNYIEEDYFETEETSYYSHIGKSIELFGHFGKSPKTTNLQLKPIKKHIPTRTPHRIYYNLFGKLPPKGMNAIEIYEQLELFLDMEETLKNPY